MATGKSFLYEMSPPTFRRKTGKLIPFVFEWKKAHFGQENISVGIFGKVVAACKFGQ